MELPGDSIFGTICTVKEQKKSTFTIPFLGLSGGAKNESAKSQNLQQRPTRATNKKLQLRTHSKVYMQGCHLSKAIKVPFRTSTQSRSCPRKKIDKKANQKQQSKPKRQKTHNHNTNQTKTTERMGSPPAMGITCMMTSYVSFL